MNAIKTVDLHEQNRPQQGSYEIRTDGKGQRIFWFCCPGPCKQVSILRLRPLTSEHQKPGVQSWEWDGNEDAPTLQPSINHVGCWHGWLTSGVFRSC